MSLIRTRRTNVVGLLEAASLREREDLAGENDVSASEGNGITSRTTSGAGAPPGAVEAPCSGRSDHAVRMAEAGGTATVLGVRPPAAR